MSHQLAASEWRHGLDPESNFPDVTSGAAGLLQLQHKFNAEQLAQLSRALHIPIWPGLPVAKREPEPAPREWPQHRVRRQATERAGSVWTPSPSTPSGRSLPT
ncbi:MAG TPA: hypothetical protein VJU61_02560 [Polyangiaceae bacterium]|nr:hypothetical protein [Polyangiaceae bacterium]